MAMRSAVHRSAVALSQRCFSAQPAVVTKTSAVRPPSGRLQALRERLDAEGASLAGFSGDVQYGSPVPKRTRGEGGVVLHRKPPWLKVGGACCTRQN
jgi:hypothetical protein